MNKKSFGQGLALALALVASTGQGADIAQGKSKAAMCAGCHGSDGQGSSSGIGITDEFPNLAGQKQAYLLKQLKAFKAGTRKDPTMSAMAAVLNESDMQNLAAYFSSLSPAHAAAAPAAVTGKKPSAREFPAAVYITMKKSGTLEQFPQETVWPGGPNMLYDAVTPDGSKLLATSPSSNRVYVFDTRSGKQLAVLPVGKAPKGVKVSPDGHWAYVSNQGSANISVVDLRRLAVVDTIAVEKGPHNVRFTRDGRLAYVTLQGGAGIGVVDTARRKLVRVIPVPGITGPHNLDLSADEKTAYVRDFVHHVAVLDLTSGKVEKVLEVGNGHGGIDVTPDDRYVATAAIGDDIISIIDTKTLAVKNIRVGQGPHGIRASKDSHWLYVTLTGEQAVAVVNLQTLRLEKKIAAGKFPFWVAVRGNP